MFHTLTSTYYEKENLKKDTCKNIKKTRDNEKDMNKALKKYSTVRNYTNIRAYTGSTC